MRKLSVILTILILTSMLVPAVVAQDPGAVIEANPTGELSGSGAGISGTGTLWENGEPDGVNGLSSEQETNVPASRTADDFYLDDACPLYDIDVIRVDLLQDPGIIDAGVELYLDNGGLPADAPFFEQWGYDTKTWIGNWFSRDGYEFEFFTPGLQLPPGTYWLSGINWQGAGQGFWLTASPGWGSQIYFKSEHFGYPNWVTGETVFGAQYNVAFDIDGECAEPQGPPNDECENATVVDTLPFNDVIDTTLATLAPDDPLMGCGYLENSHTVWYSFTAPSDGTAYIETCGSNYDTVLAIWEGSCGAGNLIPVTCNDDSCGLQSEMWVPVVGGTTYLIEAAAYSAGSGGILDFTVEFTSSDEPDIYIEPTELNESLCTNETKLVQMYICNEGTAPLEWSMEEVPGGLTLERPKGVLVSGPEALSRWPGKGDPVLNVQPAAPLAAPAPEALTFYADRPTFDGDFPGLPVEGYENYNYDPGVVGFGMPLDENTDNGIWSPGAILPGISFWATGGDPGSELVALGPTSGWGNPDMSVMANFFVEDYIIQFDPPVQAAGMDLTSLLGADYCDVDIYGTGGYLGSISAACSVAGNFWGVASDGDPITQIVISDQADGAEGADNIAFGGGGAPPDIPWLSEDPTGGTVEPGECQTVNVTFDSTGLAPDVYTGNLLIESNDPDEPQVWVPVTMTVEPCENLMYAVVRMRGKMQGGAYIVNAVVRVKDIEGNPIEGADVTMFLKKPNANTKTQTRTTGVNGRTIFPMASPIGGYWLACIEDVQHPDWVWADGPKCYFLEFPAP